MSSEDRRQHEKRGAGGSLRVPFVRRCSVEFEGEGARSAFLVNISVLGAYISDDQQAVLGTRGVCSFKLPGNALSLPVKVVVAWVNPRQQHPIHGLPPGYGLRFEDLSPGVHFRIEALVADYVGKRGGAG
jgi:hypothetical protein